MKSKLVKLKDCTEIRPGFSLKRTVKNQQNGTHQIVMMKHLSKGEPYRYQDEHQLRIIPSTPPDKYLIKPGDILFVSRGANNYSVLIDKIPEPTIAPIMFYILKTQRNSIPEYLMWCMEQIPFLSFLAGVRTGALSPIIKRVGFMDIQIPLPGLALQRSIGNLWRLQVREQRLRQQISAETERLKAHAGKKLYEKLIGELN